MLVRFLSSCVLIAVVTALRYVFRGRIRPQIQYALWLPVLLRLLIPTASVRTLSPVLCSVWLLGAAAVTVCLLIANVRLHVRLKRNRSVLNVADSTIPVYMVEGVETPCLCGLFRPAVYVPLEALENDVRLPKIVTHELCHYRQLDHVWCVLRCLCLVVHWFDPLVWLAAILSARDMELSTDAQSVRRLGEEEREAYCACLPQLTCEQKLPAVHLAATMMTFGTPALRERTKLTGKTPKYSTFVLVVVLVLTLAAAAGCLIAPHFAPKPEAPAVVEIPEEPEEPEELPEEPAEPEPEELTEEPEEPEKPEDTEVILTTLTPADAIQSILEAGDATLTLSLSNGEEYASLPVAGDSPAAQQLSALVDGCLWSQDEAPSPEPFDCRLTVSGADGKTVTIASRYLQYDPYHWSAEETAEGYTFFTNARRIYDELEADCTNIVFDANNAKTAATTFINSAYGDYMSHLEPENPLLISDYYPVDREIRQISGDGSEVRGCFHYTFDSDAPEGTWPNAELRDTGAYNGYWEFVLQKQDDGRWKCIELSCP